MRKAPHEWSNMESVIDNNYRNMRRRDVKSKGQEAADQETALNLVQANDLNSVSRKPQENKSNVMHAGVPSKGCLLHPDPSGR